MYKHLFIKLFFSSILLIFFLTGCALLYKGTKEDVYFDSTPRGANVYVNGVPVDSTPCFVPLKSNGDYSVEVKKEGYQTKTYRITGDISWGWILADFFSFPTYIGALFDFLVGSPYYLDKTDINTEMEKVEEKQK